MGKSKTVTIDLSMFSGILRQIAADKAWVTRRRNARLLKNKLANAGRKSWITRRKNMA